MGVEEEGFGNLEEGGKIVLEEFNVDIFFGDKSPTNYPLDGRKKKKKRNDS